MSRTQSSNKPTTLIVHGANFLGERLFETLATQKSNLILLDEFTRSNKDLIRELKKKHGVTAYDLSAIPELSEKIARLDYIIILLDQYLLTNFSISSKNFLTETNAIDALYKLAIDQGTKVILTTSISLHRKLVASPQEEISTLKDVSASKPYTPAELQRYCENLTAEYHDQATLNARITRLGETIGEGMPLQANTIFVQMLKEAITKSRITIPGEGLDYSYYVHVMDAVFGIIKALFSNKTNGEVFSLSYPEEISTLNLAYKILELNPRASEIVFAEAPDDSPAQHMYLPAKNLSKIGWSPKIPFEKGLYESMSYFHSQYNITWKDKPDIEKKPAIEKVREKTPRSEAMTPFGSLVQSISAPFTSFFSRIKSSYRQLDERPITGKDILRYFILVVIATIAFFGLIGPVIQITVGSAGAYYYGKRGYDSAISLNTESAENSLAKAQNYSSLLQTGWHGLRWMKYISPAEKFYTETAKLTSSVTHLSNGGYYLVQGLHPYAEYFKNFEPITSFGPSAGGGSREYLQELELMEERVPSIEMAAIEISLAKEALDTLDTSVFPTFISNKLDLLSDKATEAESAVSTLESFAFYIPEILGKEERQTYVILFQNPMELRSTGGWLTSVAIVGIEHGQVRELEVKDVYDIDGQITENIAPPASMAEALNINSWSLSLSNWSPDFPESAESAEYFLKLSDDIVEADGIIAVDLEFVRDLIDVWGEVSVPGEAEPVTKDSLYDKVIEIHRSFTPGSTAKPVFLSNLANEIVQKILSSSRDSWPEIGKKIVTNLNKKHILLYFHNTEVRNILDENKWSGHITEKRNLIFPVEWNGGGNKANHFIKRSTDFTVNVLSDSSVQQTLSVSYENTSTTNRYPEGDYKDFVRVYLPSKSRVSRIEGLTTTQVSDDESSGMLVVSGWITVPVNGKASYTITYRQDEEEVALFPLERKAGGAITYHLYFTKQPGLGDDPFTIDISYPSDWTPLDLTNIHRELNALIQRTDLTSDKEFSLTWER